MWNVSTYMKVLKQRFSQWFNGHYAGRGTLWEDRYRCDFSDGAVIGGKAFVDEMFAAFRDRFGPKRKDGARPLRCLAGDSPDERQFNLRQLRTGVFG